MKIPCDKKLIDLGFVCEKGVHYQCFDVGNHFLSRHIVMHMSTFDGEVFLLMITMFLRNEKLRIIVMFFVFFYVWSRMLRAMELHSDTRVQKVLKIPNKGLSLLLFCL
jgi:hypothetical protein